MYTACKIIEYKRQLGHSTISGPKCNFLCPWNTSVIWHGSVTTTGSKLFSTWQVICINSSLSKVTEWVQTYKVCTNFETKNKLDAKLHEWPTCMWVRYSSQVFHSCLENHVDKRARIHCSWNSKCNEDNIQTAWISMKNSDAVWLWWHRGKTTKTVRHLPDANYIN